MGIVNEVHHLNAPRLQTFLLLEEGPSSAGQYQGILPPGERKHIRGSKFGVSVAELQINMGSSGLSPLSEPLKPNLSKEQDHATLMRYRTSRISQPSFSSDSIAHVHTWVKYTDMTTEYLELRTQEVGMRSFHQVP